MSTAKDPRPVEPAQNSRPPTNGFADPDAGPDSLAILNGLDLAAILLDRDLNILFATSAARPLFSVIATDVGRPLRDLSHRFGATDFLRDARIVVTNGVAASRQVEADTGAWYISRTLPYGARGGRPEGVLLTFTDVSELKRSERRIHAESGYLESIIDTVRQPLVVLDDRLQVISANRSFYRLLNVSAAVTAGRSLTAVGDGLLAGPGLAAFLDLLSAGSDEIEDHEAVIELPSIGHRTLMLGARRILDVPSASRKILVAIEDVTERRRVEEALDAAKQEAELANRGKSRFLAAASHDLRQPLQTLSLLQGVLKRTIKDPAALKLVGKFDDTLGAMTGMLNTLLDINQLEAGIVLPVPTDFSINDVLQQLKAEFAFHAQAGGLEWRVVTSSVSVRTDRHLLEQVLRNLLSNAVKYTRDGRVLLGCRHRGDQLRIEVWDTGIGIPRGQLGAIFEEFHQLDNAARERSRGLGLGLSIAQRLVSLLGHSIDVRSRPGEGSVFSIEVPITVGNLSTGSQRSRPVASDSAVTGATVLIVEDDPALSDVLELLFSGDGHRTSVAAHGREALAMVAARDVRPDIVIADYNLPGGLTGIEVMQALRDVLKRDVPFIILTGDISTETMKEIARHGCVQLNKPVKSDELTQLVRSLLAKRARPGGRPATPTARPARTDGETPAIFIVDDDVHLRQSLAALLVADGRSVESYDSSEAFLADFRPNRSGCLVIDARLPGMSGLELLEHLQKRGGGLPAIMLTGHGDVPTAVRAMEAGASGFIEKPVRPDVLLARIDRALVEGRSQTELNARRAAASALIAALTQRERQVMDLVVAGNPNKEIAALLGINQRTVENHRATVMRKTKTGSLSDLIHLEFAARRATVGDYFAG